VTTRARLAGVRALHTAVFFVELASIGWLVLTGWHGRRDRTVAIAAGLVAAEGLVFVANSGVCPLTPLAERLGARRGSVSDIFLPDAVARTIPQWTSALVALAVVLHVRSARATCRTRAEGGRRPQDAGLPRDAGLPQVLRRPVRRLADTARAS
jgi:hypothetical protein